MMKSIAAALWLSLCATRGAAMAAILGSNASNLRAHCAKNPHQTSYGKSECPCVGMDNLKGYYAAQLDYYHVQYTAETGSSCEAWDNGKHPDCRGDMPPQWCQQSWCYVDPCNCHLDVIPKPTKTTVSYQGSPAYWSYNTCGGFDFYSQEMSPDSCVMQKTASDCSKNSKCAWNGEKCGGKEAIETCHKAKSLDASLYGEEDCRCVGLGGRDVGKAFMFTNQHDMAQYPANLGSTCHNWEMDAHPDCKKENKPAWCTAKWCFVDPCKCHTGVPPKSVMGENKHLRFQGKAAYWSYSTCGSSDKDWADTLKSQYCVSQETEAACAKMSEKCAWNGEKCLGIALVTTCAKQRETGILGIEAELPLGGTQGKTLFTALVVMIGSIVAA